MCGILSLLYTIVKVSLIGLWNLLTRIIHVGEHLEISVEIMAIIKRPEGLPRNFVHQCDVPISIQNMMKSLGFELEDLKLMQFYLTSSGSGEQQRVGKRQILADSDILFITIPIGGG